MLKDNLYTGEEAQSKLIAGFNKVADAVKGTLGASGYNGLLEHPFSPFSETTNDGVSIANAIELVDPIERMGANIAKEIASRSDKQSYDGTTTAVTFGQAIIKEGVKVKCSPMQLKRELEACLPLIEASIDAQKKEITVDTVGTVATISAEDSTIGSKIQEIYQQIGKDGILFRDFSKTFEDYYTLSKGIQIPDAGFASPYMADMSEDGQMVNVAQYKNPKILITKQKISGGRDFEEFFGRLYKENVRELVIFADDYEPTLITELVMTRAKRSFKTVLVKMPVLWKDWWFEDLAKMTGATIIDPAAGISHKNLKPEHLGTCDNIIIDKKNTYIEGITDISNHIKNLEAIGDEDSKIRIARMNQKTARYFVGAPSDQALSYRKLKVEDACGAAYQALQGGIVVGGGIALLNASRELPDTLGGRILKEALKAPVEQICINAGCVEVNVDVKEDFGGTRGYDAKKGLICDLMEAEIIDPANVVKTSVRNAISVAAQILTVKVITHLPKPEVKYVANINANQPAGM